MAGAHRLLQVRTRVLNQQLRKDFERWHPQLRTAADPVCQAAQPPNWTALHLRCFSIIPREDNSEGRSLTRACFQLEARIQEFAQPLHDG
jgi:hypothetical protein